MQERINKHEYQTRFLDCIKIAPGQSIPFTSWELLQQWDRLIGVMWRMPNSCNKGNLMNCENCENLSLIVIEQWCTISWEFILFHIEHTPATHHNTTNLETMQGGWLGEIPFSCASASKVSGCAAPRALFRAIEAERYKVSAWTFWVTPWHLWKFRNISGKNLSFRMWQAILSIFPILVLQDSVRSSNRTLRLQPLWYTLSFFR